MKKNGIIAAVLSLLSPLPLRMKSLQTGSITGGEMMTEDPDSPEKQRVMMSVISVQLFIPVTTKSHLNS